MNNTIKVTKSGLVVYENKKPVRKRFFLDEKKYQQLMTKRGSKNLNSIWAALGRPRTFSVVIIFSLAELGWKKADILHLDAIVNTSANGDEKAIFNCGSIKDIDGRIPLFINYNEAESLRQRHQPSLKLIRGGYYDDLAWLRSRIAKNRQNEARINSERKNENRKIRDSLRK